MEAEPTFRLHGSVRLVQTRRNGATWQADTVAALQHHQNLDRPTALHEMLHRYADLALSNDPVHTWPVR